LESRRVVAYSDELTEHRFRVGDYLTDGKTHLYYVKHIFTDGDYDLENCRTGWALRVQDDFVKNMKRLKYRAKKEKVVIDDT
jgi:hypothetical protein